MAESGRKTFSRSGSQGNGLSADTLITPEATLRPPLPRRSQPAPLWSADPEPQPGHKYQQFHASGSSKGDGTPASAPGSSVESWRRLRRFPRKNVEAAFRTAATSGAAGIHFLLFIFPSLSGRRVHIGKVATSNITHEQRVNPPGIMSERTDSCSGKYGV